MGDSGVVSLDALTEAFEKIQAASGVDDLDVLVNNFIKSKQVLLHKQTCMSSNVLILPTQSGSYYSLITSNLLKKFRF